MNSSPFMGRWPEGPKGRALEWPDCQNTRDLGGLRTQSGVTRSRILIRSDHLGHLNAVGREALLAYGVSTVLDLRSEGETVRSPSPFADGVAVRYVHKALIDDKNMNNIGDSKNMLERYLFIIDTRRRAFRDAFQAIAQAEGSVLFHCFAGKDRTGVVAAMLLSLAGVLPGDIADDYTQTDVQLARQYEIWIDEAPVEKRDAFRDELRCPPERILGVLDYMDRKWAGVAGYLEAAGMEPNDVESLSTRLS